MHWFQNMRLSAKLISTFCVVLVLIGGQSLFAYQTTTGSLESARWVEHTYEVMGSARTALAGLVDMETGYRGFLVTGKDEFLEPYNNGIEVYQEKLRALQEKTADNPTQVERWKDLEQRAVAWQREMTEPGTGIAARHYCGRGYSRRTDSI